jgi:hypothetical protein
MSKDPAFLFYSSDFLNGVSDLTMEERGQYITLLCLQHQKGELSDKTIRLSVGSVSVDVLKKFDKNEEGFYFQKRLAIEIEKRKVFTESRRNNGKMGGRKPLGNPNDKPLGKPKNKPKKNHIEDVNENVNESINEDEKYEILLPFSSSTFLQIWGQWKEYKRKEHEFKYKTPQSEQAALMDLTKKANHNELTAIEIIGQSMANGWKGFFELKNNNNGKAKSTIDLRSAVQAEFDKRHGGGQ